MTGQKFSAINLNGENDIDSSEYSKGSNFAIGGNTLRCGVTCPWLSMVYYASIANRKRPDENTPVLWALSSLPVLMCWIINGGYYPQR